MKFTESEFYKIIDALEAHSRTSIPSPISSQWIDFNPINFNPITIFDRIMGKDTADMRRINQLKFEVDTRNLSIKLLENKGEFVETKPRTEPKVEDDSKRD